MLTFETIYSYLYYFFTCFITFVRLPIFSYGGVSISILDFCIAMIILSVIIVNLVPTNH